VNVFRFPPVRGRATAVALAALTVVGASACSGGTSTSAAGTSTSAGGTSASATTSSSDAASASPTPTASAATPAATPPAAQGQVVAITVAGGKVSGPAGRVKVAKGSTVTLQVTSDVADEVHLHGYDKSVDVEKGGTATLTFQATLTGVFEVELESRGLQLTQLQVQ
jgi:hypothetical protein